MVDPCMIVELLEAACMRAIFLDSCWHCPRMAVRLGGGWVEVALSAKPQWCVVGSAFHEPGYCNTRYVNVIRGCNLCVSVTHCNSCTALLAREASPPSQWLALASAVDRVSHRYVSYWWNACSLPGSCVCTLSSFTHTLLYYFPHIRA